MDSKVVVIVIVVIVGLVVMRDCQFYYSASYASRGVSRELNMAADS